MKKSLIILVLLTCFFKSRSQCTKVCISGGSVTISGGSVFVTGGTLSAVSNATVTQKAGTQFTITDGSGLLATKANQAIEINTLTTMSQSLTNIWNKLDTIRTMYDVFEIVITQTAACASATMPLLAAITNTTSYTLPSGKWICTSITSKQTTGNYLPTNICTFTASPTYTIGSALNSSVAVQSFIASYNVATNILQGTAGGVYVWKALSTTDFNYLKDQIYSGTFFIMQLCQTNGTTYSNAQNMNFSMCFKRVQ